MPKKMTVNVGVAAHSVIATSFSLLRRCVKVLCVSFLLAGLVPAQAQSVSPRPLASLPASASPPPVFKPDPAYDAEALVKRYPPQSIVSVELADEALKAVKKGRQQANEIFKREEAACYKTFFANRCVDQAKARRRNALLAIRPIQVEAERYKRHRKVVKRDSALEKRQAEKMSEAELAEKQEENRAAFESKQRRRKAAQQKVLDKRARTEQRRKEKAASAAKREKNRKAAMEKAGVVSQPAATPTLASPPAASAPPER